MESVVHFRAAVALLGRFPALAGIDLDVARGQIVHLRGANGAGKTTLLRACAGLVPVVAGDARVLGCDLRTEPRAVRRRVGLAGHGSALYDDLTVAENVRFWGRAVKARKVDVEDALEVMGLAGRLRDVQVVKLSAGQRRRTSLACLLARRPELWLLDEPHAGLDSSGRERVDGLVRQAVQQGATVLLSSHELERAESLADVTVDLAAGTNGGPAHVVATMAASSGTSTTTVRPEDPATAAPSTAPPAPPAVTPAPAGRDL
jgi:heme ABC exporter ATP-binding subunit CcmA